jgi:hypothetical protein
MMGSRGWGNGFQCETLSQRSRRLSRWRPGLARQAKRSFWKRSRKVARLVAAKEAA